MRVLTLLILLWVFAVSSNSAPIVSQQEIQQEIPEVILDHIEPEVKRVGMDSRVERLERIAKSLEERVSSLEDKVYLIDKLKERKL